jgi:hypothetical protein
VNAKQPWAAKTTVHYDLSLTDIKQRTVTVITWSLGIEQAN